MNRFPPGDELLQEALAAQSRGELQQADARYREHLRRHRDDPAGLAAYGDFCLQRGQAMAACWLLHRAAQIRTGETGLLARLGYAYLRDRNPGAALEAFTAVLEINPQDPLALNGVGLSHMLAEAPALALEAFVRATAADPRDASILANGAEARSQVGDHAGAVVWIERAARIAPRETTLPHARLLREAGQSDRAWMLLGLLGPNERGRPQTLLEAVRCLRSLGRHAEAIGLLATLERQTPGTADYFEEMGHCLPSPRDAAQRHAHWLAACELLVAQRKLGRARTLLERLLGEDERHAAAWKLLGTVQLVRANEGEAEHAFRKAIASDPADTDAWSRLAQWLEERNQLAEARRIVETAPQPQAGEAAASSEAAIQLQLVSCRLSRREQRLENALAEADALERMPLSDEQRLQATFERARVLDLLDRPAEAMAAFTSGNTQAARFWAQSNPGPNRLLAEVDELLALARHGWLDRWPPPEAGASAPGGESDPVFLVGFPRSGTTLMEQILDGNSRLQVLREEATAVKMRDIVRCMPDGYPRSVPRLDRIDVAYLRRAYSDAVAACCKRDRTRLLVDKQPLQMTRAALIQRVFPQSHYVFLARHPCDTILSCFMQNFTPNDATANFFSLTDTVRLYLRTMELWEIFRGKLGLSVHTVRYDRLVDDFEGEMRQLCDYLGVPWEQQQARFADRASGGRRITTPSYEQVSQPIYRRAIGRWEKYRGYFEPWLPQLQPYIERYG